MQDWRRKLMIWPIVTSDSLERRLKQALEVESRLDINDVQAPYLGSATLLEESGPPKLTRRLVVAIAVMMGGLIAWLAITPIQQKTVVPGQVIPSGRVNVIEHLEGGIVSEILVRDGDIVKQDQLLMKMAPEAALAERDQLKARQVALNVEIARIKAFVNDTEPDFSAPGVTLQPQLVANQLEILKSQRDNLKSQKEVLDERLKQKQSELISFEQKKKNAEKQLGYLKEQAKIQFQLYEKGLLSKIVYLRTERELAQLEGQIAEANESIVAAKAAVEEAQRTLIELDTRLKNEALIEMGKLSSELAQVDEALAKTQDRVNRLEVRAPLTGIVQGLSVNTIGSVVSPGEQLMEIVPLEGKLIVEAAVPPKDIGQLKLGQKAEVQVSAYDFTRYGMIQGMLTSISPSTFTNEEGQLYYKANVELEKDYVGDDPAKLRLLPGMTVQVSILTGEKTLLEYLLKPVYVSLNQAFSEQ